MVTPLDLAGLVAPLFVPADRPDRFAKAAGSGADAVIVDLEDAVAATAKDRARDNLAALAPLAVPMIVRINALGTPWRDDDLRLLRSIGPGVGVMVPKVESVADVAAVRAALGPEVAIVGLVESAKGLAAVETIAEAVDRLAFGSLDYCLDLGCAHVEAALLLPRSRIVLAARLAGAAPPIDGVTADLERPDQLATDVATARALGFTAKLAVHPRQIAPIVAGFRPTEAERARAERILAAPDGETVSIDGGMVDEPVRRAARALLARATLA